MARILVVNDLELTPVLREEGYDVVEVHHRHVGEALGQYADIALIITNILLLPQKKQLKADYPSLKIIWRSGIPLDQLVQKGAIEKADSFLPLWCSFELLLLTTERLLGQESIMDVDLEGETAA